MVLEEPRKWFNNSHGDLWRGGGRSTLQGKGESEVCGEKFFLTKSFRPWKMMGGGMLLTPAGP